MVTSALRSVFAQENASDILSRWDDLAVSLAESFPKACPVQCPRQRAATPRPQVNEVGSPSQSAATSITAQGPELVSLTSTYHISSQRNYDPTRDLTSQSSCSIMIKLGALTPTECQLFIPPCLPSDSGHTNLGIYSKQMDAAQLCFL
jgi:hypothetical protein